MERAIGTYKRFEVGSLRLAAENASVLARNSRGTGKAAWGRTNFASGRVALIGGVQKIAGEHKKLPVSIKNGSVTAKNCRGRQKRIRWQLNVSGGVKKIVGGGFGFPVTPKMCRGAGNYAWGAVPIGVLENDENKYFGANALVDSNALLSATARLYLVLLFARSSKLKAQSPKLPGSWFLVLVSCVLNLVSTLLTIKYNNSPSRKAECTNKISHLAVLQLVGAREQKSILYHQHSLPHDCIVWFYSSGTRYNRAPARAEGYRTITNSNKTKCAYET